jgi:hypothetical protein
MFPPASLQLMAASPEVTVPLPEPVSVTLSVLLGIAACPVPVKARVCVAADALKALSVKTALPVRGPAPSGSKSTLKLQVWLGASENALLQSAGVPEPAI